MSRRKKRRHRLDDRRPLWIYLGVAGLVLVVGVLVWTAFSSAPAPATDTRPAYTPEVLEIDRPKPLASIALPAAGGRVVMLGDSWAGGYAAQPARNGFIWLTGDHYDWNYTNYFMPGSGYLNDGANGAGTYLDRLADAPIAPDAQLVIIQGSVNDGGEKIELLTQAARDVIQKTRELYPAAQVVLVGPAPLALPVSPRTETMDTALRAAAAYEGAAYVSPIAEEWLTAENISQWIDPAAANHPTTAGHAYLADRLIGSLDALGSGQTE